MLVYEITEICGYFDQLRTPQGPWNMPYFWLQQLQSTREEPPAALPGVHQAQGLDFFSNFCNYALHVFITEQISNLSCEKTKG